VRHVPVQEAANVVSAGGGCVLDLPDEFPLLFIRHLTDRLAQIPGDSRTHGRRVAVAPAKEGVPLRGLTPATQKEGEGGPKGLKQRLALIVNRPLLFRALLGRLRVVHRGTPRGVAGGALTSQSRTPDAAL
jgi:hypothetical protein